MKNTDGLLIEIFKENEMVDSKIIPARGERSEMILYSQVAFAHLSGRFPVEFSLPLEKGDSYYPAGTYYLHASSFKVGDFGRLSFERKMILIPASSSSSKVS
ncbi:single-stranded DNA-binding protein [Vibrio cincinnatiensis]